MLQFAVVTTGMIYLFLFTHRALCRLLGEAAASGYLQLVQLSRTFSVFYENRKKRNATGCWSRTQHRKAFRETIIVCFYSDAERERLVYSRRKALVPGELTSRFCFLAAELQSISYVFCVFIMIHYVVLSKLLFPPSVQMEAVTRTVSCPSTHRQVRDSWRSSVSSTCSTWNVQPASLLTFCLSLMLFACWPETEHCTFSRNTFTEWNDFYFVVKYVLCCFCACV